MSGGAFGPGRRGSALFLVAVILVIQVATWRGTSRLRAISSENVPQAASLDKRSWSPWLDDFEEEKHKKHGKENKDKKKHNDGNKHTRKGDDKDKKHSTSTSHSSPTHTSTTLSSSSSLTTKTGLPSSSTASACRPLPTAVTPEELCQHISAYCPPSGHLDYLHFFYCIGLDERPSPRLHTSSPTSVPQVRDGPGGSKPDDAGALVHSESQEHQDGSTLTTRVKVLRVLALSLIITWMLFLFSWVGIVASDFFCPNLSTLAARLGLSESTAGVTFLAFGNGSPDVFSTFGAMRTGSGSLAIGELIGAASFIVSVISGSMMLIAPFRVKRYPFLRDVGFFTVAVSMTMAFLLDGKLRFGECLSLIALYLTYAATIIVGSWWQERRRRQKLQLASIRSEHSVSAGYDGLSDTEGQAQSVQTHASPLLAPMSAIEYEPDIDPFTQWAAQQDASPSLLTPHSNASPAHSPLLLPHDPPSNSSASREARLQRFRAGVLARHSLLGAVEFRDVVRSLRQESAVDRSIEIYQSRDPERFLPHAHSHQHLQPDDTPDRRHSRTKSLTRPKTKSFLSQASPDIRASLIRSRSTVGSSAEVGPLTDVSRPTLEQVGEPSGLASVAAAVGDPWKEHGPADGCDPVPLPPPAMPFDEHRDRQSGSHDGIQVRDTVAHNKPILPRLAIRQATASSQDHGASNERLKDSHRTAYETEESPFASWGAFKKRFKPIMRALFPSLRHFREKSWLGIAIGLATAPAILLLKLTLPVVDDEAERAVVANEKHQVYLNGSGASSGHVRLEGGETTLMAHPRSARMAADESDDEIDGVGRGVIDLSTSSVENPWSGPVVNGDADDQGEEDNRRQHLDIASALRQLPEDASPLLQAGDGPRTPSQSSSRGHHDVDADSVASQETCRSQDSHVASPSSHIFLIVAQCALAPPFCVWAITSSARSKHVYAKVLLALLCGLAVASIVLLADLRARRAGYQTYPRSVVAACGWARVAMGFFVSILYIMSIVDEVVSILQTLGLVLGLSDAILGLTVFAMGNSLGDLVANITIAKMGHPVMAISACFAGPLLNLLLGIGISGSWLLSRNHVDDNWVYSTLSKELKEPGIYHIDFSPTLTVSGFGLLVILIGTLIAVPLNGFYLNRTIGITLIATYTVIMCVNIGVEIYNLQGVR